jgi:hypothetical protein
VRPERAGVKNVKTFVDRIALGDALFELERVDGGSPRRRLGRASAKPDLKCLIGASRHLVSARRHGRQVVRASQLAQRIRQHRRSPLRTRTSC